MPYGSSDETNVQRAGDPPVGADEDDWWFESNVDIVAGGLSEFFESVGEGAERLAEGIGGGIEAVGEGVGEGAAETGKGTGRGVLAGVVLTVLGLIGLGAYAVSKT